MYRTMLLLAVVASALSLRQLATASSPEIVRTTRDREAMFKTLHLLREMEDAFGKLSRPSWTVGTGRQLGSELPTETLWVQRRATGRISPEQYLRLLNIDREYSHRSRPR
ncbi:uncharacterized protein LOC119111233 [Pollicipes pollicipes]|uniref:uncharacterized protein LOC119111233 n=1 Tax=Pollicipes pollicipes TaxID=41117 RepID=UPI001884E029|nr:uncharacterized protein LOC119111233 [Pollicipes pollicipes]